MVEGRPALVFKCGTMVTAELPRPCLKRRSTLGEGSQVKKRSVTINSDANVVKLVSYYGRPQQSPELSRRCFYTEDDCMAHNLTKYCTASPVRLVSSLICTC